MKANLTQQEIDTLWEQGFRPYEIYTYNKEPVHYCNKLCDAGTISGWNIEFVFSTRERLKTYPHFDAVIGVDTMTNVETVWKGAEQ